MNLNMESANITGVKYVEDRGLTCGNSECVEYALGNWHIKVNSLELPNQAGKLVAES